MTSPVTASFDSPQPTRFTRGRQAPLRTEMSRLQRLWNDERGGLISAEYLLLGTFLAIGLIASAAAVKDALISKISQIAGIVCK